MASIFDGGEKTTSQTLPNPADEQFKSGDANRVSNRLQRSVKFDTVADMKAATGQYELVDGQPVEWLGYHTKGDGGGNAGVFSSTQTIQDNGSVFFVATGGQVDAIFSESINVRKFGATGDGVTDDASSIISCISYLESKIGGECVLDNGVFLHSLSIPLSTSKIKIKGVKATLKASAVMTSQIQMGNGVNRVESQSVSGLTIDGDGKSDYGIQEKSTRISFIQNNIIQNQLEYCIYQNPENSLDLFSEFLRITDNQGFDSKGFYKHTPTSVCKATDNTIARNVMFRASEWFATVNGAQRFSFEDNMIGSHVATFNGGIDIFDDGTFTLTNSAEHTINKLYIESDNTYGSGMIGVQVGNSSSNNIAGCNIENIIVEPANLVTQIAIRTPTGSGEIRQNFINGLDTKAGFSDSIIIESGISWTRISGIRSDNNISSYINDSGSKTIVNSIIEDNFGAGNPPVANSLMTGDFVLNTANGSLFTKDKGGNNIKVTNKIVDFKETRNIASIAAGANLIEDFTVSDSDLGDFVLHSCNINTEGLIMHPYCRGGVVSISIYNPTALAIDLASCEFRLQIYKY
tara:strand:- start:121 stop:1848 length:1728 start_codon:yes stop_codon:yes gene_type:complete